MAIFEAPAGGEVPCDEPGGGGCRVALTGPVTWQPRP
jgi:hypothetical protein